jgi:threonine dehydrogenase-like Zn-dependent dehydrogenase
MRTVSLLGDRHVEVRDQPEPEPRQDHVVVKVMASSICGTERHAYDHGMAGPARANGVQNAGHEATGVVWKAMSSSGLKEGRRVNLFAVRSHCGRCRHCAKGRWVLCQGESTPPTSVGFHSQYVLLRQDFCLPLADDVSFGIGALFSDVLGTTLHAIKRLHIQGGDSVLITGQGPVGLAATLLCSFFGATVIAVDLSDSRLELARRCGAAATINSGSEELDQRVRELAGHEGVDAAIDCAGFEATRLACLRAVRRGGRVALVGLAEGLRLDGANYRDNFFLKDLDLIASWYSDPADMFELEDMARRGLDPGRLVTHEYLLEQAPEAYVTMFGGASGKVIVTP